MTVESRKGGTNSLAVVSMVLGALWIFWVGSLLALILGYTSLAQIKKTGDEGRGFAIAGIIFGWFGVGLLLVLGLLIVMAAQNQS